MNAEYIPRPHPLLFYHWKIKAENNSQALAYVKILMAYCPDFDDFIRRLNRSRAYLTRSVEKDKKDGIVWMG